uniref:Uncharacterized protein n=1 Tax=Brassica oleracea var. oleracea TaxID=109376 RepID=A0A0D3BT59_BRAOL
MPTLLLLHFLTFSHRTNSKNPLALGANERCLPVLFVTSDSYYSLGNYSLEIFEDPSAMALVEVGILYTQRDPSFFRPISQGIKRCLVRWLIQQRMKMSYWSSTKYWWQRIIRRRYYKHLMLGYRT